jgi:hypothetical protein
VADAERGTQGQAARACGEAGGRDGTVGQEAQLLLITKARRTRL